MTQEQKDLLLKDLCGRLPYGTKCKYYDCCEGDYDEGTIKGFERQEYIQIDGRCIHIEEVKPYLFPLSSMTEEQMDKVEEILMSYDPKIIFDFMADGDIIFKKGNISIKAFMELTQYFDKEMLDYRGLIHMGLANNATGLNIY